MPWIHANGASLRYELTANPGKPLLVLVHEAGGCLESYDDCMAGLAPHFRVSYATSTQELEDACTRIQRACASLR